DDAADQPNVKFTVLEMVSGKPVPCRIHLKESAPGSPALRAGRLPFWHDHFVCPGTVQVKLAPGNYRYEIERGPEYQQSTGMVTVTENGDKKITIQLKRLVDLASEGWWSGETHIHRPMADIELLMQAEDLHVAPVITWWNNRNKWEGQEPPANRLARFDGNRF